MAERIEAALAVVPAERLQVGPDCGMKYLPRELALREAARAGRGCADRARAALAQNGLTPRHGAQPHRAGVDELAHAGEHVADDRRPLLRVGEERVEEQREEARVALERLEHGLAQARGRQRRARAAPVGEVRQVVVGVEQLPAERQRRDAAGSAPSSGEQ